MQNQLIDMLPCVFTSVIFPHNKWMSPHSHFGLLQIRVQIHILEYFLIVSLEDATQCLDVLQVIVTRQNLFNCLLTRRDSSPLAELSHYLH